MHVMLIQRCLCTMPRISKQFLLFSHACKCVKRGLHTGTRIVVRIFDFARLAGSNFLQMPSDNELSYSRREEISV